MTHTYTHTQANLVAPTSTVWMEVDPPPRQRAPPWQGQPLPPLPPLLSQTRWWVFYQRLWKRKQALSLLSFPLQCGWTLMSLLNSRCKSVKYKILMLTTDFSLRSRSHTGVIKSMLVSSNRAGGKEVGSGAGAPALNPALPPSSWFNNMLRHAS